MIFSWITIALERRSSRAAQRMFNEAVHGVVKFNDEDKTLEECLMNFIENTIKV